MLSLLYFHQPSHAAGVQTLDHRAIVALLIDAAFGVFQTSYSSAFVLLKWFFFFIYY